MFIDKTEKRILRLMQENPPDYPPKVSEPSTFSLSYLQALSELDRMELITCLKHLNEAGYIAYAPMIENKEFGTMHLTYTGRHYDKNCLARFKRYLLENWIAIAALIISIISLLKP